MGKRGSDGAATTGYKMPKLKAVQNTDANPVPFDADWQDIALTVGADFVAGFKGPLTLIQMA